jgi:outer membrane protein assembly factor BamB
MIYKFPWRILAPLLATCLMSSDAQSQEWARFRGPNGAGQSSIDLPADWADRKPVWRVDLPGAGHSSPVLWGEQLFVTSAAPDSGLRWLVSLRASDGGLLWKTESPFESHHIHVQNGFATSTPAVDAKRVYCAWASPSDYSIVAYDHRGKQLWRTTLGGYVSEHGYGTSPMLYQDLVIVTNDQDGESSLQALDANSGAIRWRVARHTREKQNASYAVPCIYKPSGGPDELIVNSWAHGMSSLNPLTGAINWEMQTFERRPVGSPVLVAGLLVGNCGDGGGNNSLVAVRPPKSSDQKPEVVYKLDKTSAPYVPTVVAAGDLAFLWSDRGIVTCIDGATGKIYWRERVGGNFSGSPVHVGNKIYCISADGDLVALAASKEYAMLGRTPLGEGSRATPAIVGNRLYARTESHLMCFEGNK